MTGIPEAQPSTGQGTHVSTTGQANCGIPAVFSMQGHSLLYHFPYCILAPLERALLFVLGLCLDLLSLATTQQLPAGHLPCGCGRMQAGARDRVEVRPLDLSKFHH